MDSVRAWLDVDEVRRLAERLVRPVREPEVSVMDAGFGDGFEGFAVARETPSVESRTVENEAPPANGDAIVPVRVVNSPSEPSGEAGGCGARGPFLDRIRRFRDWMHQQFSASGVFILDREGAVIFDESDHGRMHFLARSLALASRRPGASASNVHVKIGAGVTLEVIPVETAYGCLVLGALVPVPLSPDAVGAVMAALAEVAAPPVSA